MVRAVRNDEAHGREWWLGNRWPEGCAGWQRASLRMTEQLPTRRCAKSIGIVSPGGFLTHEIRENEALPFRPNCRDVRVSCVQKHFEVILYQFQILPAAFE